MFLSLRDSFVQIYSIPRPGFRKIAELIDFAPPSFSSCSTRVKKRREISASTKVVYNQQKDLPAN